MKDNKKTIPSFLISISLLLVSGAGSAAETNEKAGDPNRGAASWSQNCNRCHNMRSPTEFRDELWRTIITHMRLRAGLTGQQQRDILAFLQASNNPAPASVAPVSMAAQVSDEAGRPGEQVYRSTCIACHGANGKGVLPGTPDFTDPGGRLAKSDEMLQKHITEGFQSPGSPMAMPAKGGNPSLTPSEISEVLAYLRKHFGR